MGCGSGGRERGGFHRRESVCGASGRQRCERCGKYLMFEWISCWDVENVMFC